MVGGLHIPFEIAASMRAIARSCITSCASCDVQSASYDMHCVTLRHMENLLELINRILDARDETVTAFADRIGVNRLTVTRWKASLPAPETLRRIAADLAIPYSHVVMSALASAGYATCPADLLAGQQVRVITRCGDPFDEPAGAAVDAMFTDPARASEYLRVASAIAPDADIEESVVTIDSTEIPDTVRVFTTVWSSRTDQIHQPVTLCGSRPARLQDREVTDVQATALADSDLVFSLQVDSLTAEAGRTALMAVIDTLRRQGRLLPPGVDPYPGLSRSVAYALNAANRSAPQAMPSPGPIFGGAALQTVPSTFAGARSYDSDAAASGQQDPSAVWPATRQFFVDLPG
ncbi:MULTISPECIES: hypothetical protein [Mycobacteriaceae]|nr:hypothetical protein [Mycobacterium syngnathidarum]